MRYVSCAMLLMLSLMVTGCKWQTIQTTGLTGLKTETAGDIRRKFCDALDLGKLTYNSAMDTAQTVHGVRVTKAKLKSFCRDRTGRPASAR